jgi:hypothetical protein
MSDRPTVYELTIKRLKNNRAVVVVLMLFTAISAIIAFAEKVELVVEKATTWLGPTTNPLTLTSVKLSQSAAYWRPVSLDEPNLLYERELSLYSDSPEILVELKKKKQDGHWICPALFAYGEWCKKSSSLFSQIGLQENAIDPKFDLLVKNGGREPLLLMKVGVEIVHAAHVTISLGDWETREVLVDGEYEVPMPFPSKIDLGGGEIIDVIQKFEELRSEYKRDYQPFPEVIRTLLSLHYEWANLPVVTAVDIENPVHIPPGAAFRFNLVLKNYNRMPNNVVVRFVVGTDTGEAKSGLYYLLAM